MEPRSQQSYHYEGQGEPTHTTWTIRQHFSYVGRSYHAPAILTVVPAHCPLTRTDRADGGPGIP